MIRLVILLLVLLTSSDSTRAWTAGKGSAATPPQLTDSGPIVINGENGTVITGLRITSNSGDCVQIINSTNITIKSSEIGPCGTNNTTSDSRGIYITQGSGPIYIYDNYIHVENLASGCCDSHNNIFVDGTANVTIEGNIIAYGETNIEATPNNSDNLMIKGNFLLNPRGPFPRGQQIQVYGSSGIDMTDSIIRNNYTLACEATGAAPCDGTYLYPEVQEDAINAGYTTNVLIEGNYVVGGHSPSGCGILGDFNSGNPGQILNNILSNTGQCGIGVGDGTDWTVSGNKVLNLTPISGGGNTAIYFWAQYPPPCGPVTVENNIADQLKEDMTTHSGYWDGGGCDPITLINNTFNEAAYAILFPMSTTNPPPAIPPEPKNCVAVSPYTTNTTLQPCWTP